VGGRRRRRGPAHAELDPVLLELELGDVLLLEDPEDLLEIRDVHSRSLGAWDARMSKT
jgi:hypothetical protein